jgi:signal transduction histidine kinase
VFSHAELAPLYLVAGVAAGYLASKWRGIPWQMARLREDLDSRNAQLAQSGKLSAAGELAVGLAHELRHPVASLKGIASLLREPNLNAGIREECVAILGRECERMERLLTELLRFARPRQAEMTAVKAEELVEAAIGLVRYATDGNTVRFRKEVSPGLKEIRCDREQVKQVLVNLLLNAIHAMPKGGAVVVRAEEKGGTAVLEVVDEGRGVPPELMDKIFLPFVTTRAEGTGLGLSVAKQIVAQHGGELTAERNPGIGMTFRFGLPINNGGTP